MAKHVALVLTFAVLGAAAGCSKPADDAPPVAAPSVSLDRSDAAIGSPIDVTYTFVVDAAAPAFAEDYVVFVHFLNADGELMWTDDHRPPTPTREWRPGQTVTYQRTVFVPKFPYEGEAHVHVGLYSPRSNARLPLRGDSDAGRSYRVATFRMTPRTDTVFVVFGSGWHQPEVADEGRVEWQWSRKEATVSFRNPKRDVTVMLLADMPVAAFTEPQRVDVRLGGTAVDTFTLGAGQQELRRIPLTAAQFGDVETVEMTVAVDKTFVPAAVPALKSGDGRELGIRVFQVYIQPN